MHLKINCKSFEEWWVEHGNLDSEQRCLASDVWDYQQKRMDALVDAHYRNGFNAGWNAGLTEDVERLTAVQNRANT